MPHAARSLKSPQATEQEVHAARSAAPDGVQTSPHRALQRQPMRGVLGGALQRHEAVQSGAPSPTQAAIDRSPRMAAQRRAIDTAYGRASPSHATQPVQGVFTETGKQEFEDLSAMESGPDDALRQRAIALRKNEKALTDDEAEAVGRLIGKFSREQVKKGAAPVSEGPPLVKPPLFVRFANDLPAACADCGIKLPEGVWRNVIDNIWRLVEETESAIYETLPERVVTGLALMRGHLRPGMVDGLTENFVKLGSKYVNVNSIGNYKGAAAEIIDAVTSAWYVADSAPPDAVGLPSLGKREPVHPDYHTTTTSKRSGIEKTETITMQDIDRIETFGSLKFYVEVKSDVETAIDKHGKNHPGDQLWRIVGATQHVIQQTRTPCQPAVSVVHDAEWLRFFTAGTARVYSQLGVHLFIGGVRFDPAELRLLVDHVQQQQEGIEKDFFHLNIGTFPPPRLVKDLLKQSRFPPLHKP